MNVLLIGSGGREHALAWKLAQSPGLSKLYAAPGNPGIAQHAEIVALDAADHALVAEFCQQHSVALVVIGPEVPLCAGLADSLRAFGIAVFGPSRAAARLEGSKGFTKDLCQRAGIPTAGYVRVALLESATAALKGFALPVVIKADGLAAGKGVTIAQTKAEATAALETIFAEPGGEAVIEEFLDGEEASLFVLTDGQVIASFGSAQDHKRVGEGDTGPNTGGMGAYSPAFVLTPALEARAIDEIIKPTLAAMVEANTPFSGILYAGLMLTRDGPKLIEYNVRFGDPECQVLMMRLESDLLDLMIATANQQLGKLAAPQFSRNAALTVVMAARGYPGTPQTGGAITGIASAEATGAKIFHASTVVKDGALSAAGGRVLAVTVVSADIATAQQAAYRAVDEIDFESGFCRRDIGWRALGHA